MLSLTTVVVDDCTGLDCCTKLVCVLVTTPPWLWLEVKLLALLLLTLVTVLSGDISIWGERLRSKFCIYYVVLTTLCWY